ncbi:sigma-E factor regulatory protein RseB [Vibrio zhugei]|uniref:Sigma-E factor regulatory protein RseB n=1 Tax=Vibrio zhugei TaxID=2479546 RepID=A0ABV7C6S6_9VIBR|nr:sigma-E factor regulatory protein RseB [Vibrio zhugei]
MKKFLISVVMLLGLNSTNAFADTVSAKALLHQMSQASQQLNYELSYILIKKNSIEPLLYRHAHEKDQQFAHLLYLSGPVREVIRRGNEISYIEPGVKPFTIVSHHMVAPLIPMLNSKIDELSDYYDFVNIGRDREAGTPCNVIRIVPKDGLRYSYVLWVGEHSHLPLRADLVSRDGEVLEQYRTISYSVSDKLVKIMSGLENVHLPAVSDIPNSRVEQAPWKVTWVPDGFKSLEINRYRMVITDRVVENQMFSDGLFNFSVYVSKKDEHSLSNQLIRQGRRTLQTVTQGQYEISVVGDLPPRTAQRIAKSVTFTTQKAN